MQTSVSEALKRLDKCRENVVKDTEVMAAQRTEQLTRYDATYKRGVRKLWLFRAPTYIILVLGAVMMAVVGDWLLFALVAAVTACLVVVTVHEHRSVSFKYTSDRAEIVRLYAYHLGKLEEMNKRLIAMRGHLIKMMPKTVAEVGASA